MGPLNDMGLPGNFDEALQLLNGRLALDGAPRYNLVVCGGTALNATGLISRTTKDVDIVALMDDGEMLLDPAPLPQPLVDAALVVAENMGLPNDWLNNGPSSDDGGLFRLGLPVAIMPTTSTCWLRRLMNCWKPHDGRRPMTRHKDIYKA